MYCLYILYPEPLTLLKCLWLDKKALIFREWFTHPKPRTAAFITSSHECPVKGHLVKCKDEELTLNPQQAQHTHTHTEFPHMRYASPLLQADKEVGRTDVLSLSWHVALGVWDSYLKSWMPGHLNPLKDHGNQRLCSRWAKSKSGWLTYLKGYPTQPPLFGIFWNPVFFNAGFHGEPSDVG